jgi:hypothetical protein
MEQLQRQDRRQRNRQQSQTKSVAYSEVIPVLTEAIKQLKTENEALKARLDAPEAK